MKIVDKTGIHEMGIDQMGILLSDDVSKVTQTCISAHLEFFINLQRAVFGPSATLTGR